MLLASALHSPKSASKNRVDRGAKLNRECTALEDETAAVYIADIRHEAPAAFEAAGKTFIWTSSTTGFRANSAKLLVSESGPAGCEPWALHGP